MSTDGVVTILVTFLSSTVITAFLVQWFMRRKTAAETREIGARAASEEMDTARDTTDLIRKMQGEQVDLYRKNTELEKTNTDQARTIENLTRRLESRDAQLDRLTKLAQQAPIIETLREQLDAVTKIATDFQSAQSELTAMLNEKEKTLQALSQTNRDLTLKKPGQ